MGNKVTTYIKETRSELKNVHWLTRSESISYTIAVIIFSLAVAIFLGAFDFLFSYLVKLSIF